MVWVVDDLSIAPPVPLRPNTRLVKRGGFLDVYFSVTSRYLFLTHGYFLQHIPPNQVSINLWHGIPLKAIGKTAGLEGRKDTYMVATADISREAFAQAFGMPKNRIIVTGQARTDRMLVVNRKTIWDRAFPGLPEPRKIFLWLPTYRKPKFFPNRIDGDLYGNAFNCSDFSAQMFNAMLKQNNAFCFVKPHPLAAPQDQANYSNILFIDEIWLESRGLSLYQLVGATDCLISDVSSVIADFMLLDRPIILLFEDIEAYQSNRGFTFNPIKDFLPANVAQNFEQFLAELASVLAGNDPYAARRSKLKCLFFDHFDNGAADRILDQVMIGDR